MWKHKTMNTPVEDTTLANPFVSRNVKRADAAMKAAYPRKADQDEPYTLAQDTLTDIAIWCRHHGHDFLVLVESAEMTADAETHVIRHPDGTITTAGGDLPPEELP
jgi:hypothetical protein